MAKKDVSLIEQGVGYFGGLVTEMMAVVREQAIPFEAIYRLVRPSGRKTLAAMVLLAHTDWLAEQPQPSGGTGGALPDHYTVNVGYDMPRNRRRLENDFSKDGVSEPFYGNDEWSNHSSCVDIDLTPGPKIMLLKQFTPDEIQEMGGFKSKNIIAYMGARGYRPAIHLEIYAFGINPETRELQRQFWIIGLGSFTLRGALRYVAGLGVRDGWRLLDDHLFGYGWHAAHRFLFVRK